VTEGLRRLLERGVEEGLHPGAQVYVSLHGETVGSFGVGDVGVDDIAPWFSMTKLVTAVAFAVGWERHGLDLDDRVADYVPEAAVNGKDVLTLRHLLTHTAGLHGAAGRSDDVRSRPTEQTLGIVCAAPLARGWIPGERAAYDGAAGFTLLAEVVRRVDGRHFDQLAADEVFVPLGMTSSSLRLEQPSGGVVVTMHETPPRRSPGRHGLDRLRRQQPDAVALPVSEQQLDDPDELAHRTHASGTGPMRELVRVIELLLGHGERDGVRLLSAQTVEAMTARHRAGLRDETFGHVIDWGLGVMVNSRHYASGPYPYGYGPHASRRTFGHGGAESSLVFGDPEVGLAVAIFTNGMPGERANLARFDALAETLYRDLELVPIDR
jgi:CubicO group peptidase (beta-lactamase class C family)